MKKFDQLSAEAQERAVEVALHRLLEHLATGALRFNDLANGNDLQARIERVMARPDVQEIPELLPTLIYAACAPELSELARMAAHDAVYTEGETVISLEDL